MALFENDGLMISVNYSQGLVMFKILSLLNETLHVNGKMNYGSYIFHKLN